MLWKILTLAVLIWFAWWRLRQWIRLRQLRAAGEPVPEQRGIRPITILAGAMLLGYGGYLAMPILRKEHRNDLSYDEAKVLMEECLKVLFYRDARTINKVQLATVTAAGPTVSEPYEVDTDWQVGNIVYPEPVRTTFPFGDDPRV